MNTQLRTLADRRRYIARQKWRKARLREELAQALHRLDVRDDAYRRLLAANGQREADRRFTEAVLGILDAIATRHPSRPVGVGELVDRLVELRAEHGLDYALIGEVGR